LGLIVLQLEGIYNLLEKGMERIVEGNVKVMEVY
jgi:hypothetical protein